ncbi:MAG: hypothetical protein R3195_00500 [Gemmatimonadota bacterium]|nr:hypothetical protein [Gemmatimonadota bacterium]
MPAPEKTGREPHRFARIAAVIVLLWGCATDEPATDLADTPSAEPRAAPDDSPAGMLAEAPPALVEALDAELADLPGPIYYFAARVDLNGDDADDWIAHVAGPMVCGSGGCDTFVFAGAADGLRLVTSISVTRPPIGVAPTSTAGWRDILVHVAGGGLPAADARLRFDGATYPGNPTVAPAELLEPGTAGGQVVIPEFESLDEGELLRPGEAGR